MNRWMILLFLGLLISVHGAFDLSYTCATGVAFNKADCYVHTMLNFGFSSNTQASGCSSSGNCSLANAGESYFNFQDNSGTRLSLPLTKFYWAKGDTTSFATGYAASVNSSATVTIDGAAVFLFQLSSLGKEVYVYIPFTTSGSTNNQNVVNLVETSKIPNSLSHFDGNGVLSAFNFFNQDNYNQWFVQNIGDTYVLVSRYIYKVNSISNMVTSFTFSVSGVSAATLFTDTTAKSTGYKLCYASNSDWQSNLRSIVAFWFIWFLIFIYWLIYLFSDPITKTCFDRENFTDNAWTCWSLYSIFKVSHTDFFTKLSRMTVILTQITVQALIIAAIVSKQQATGVGVFVWAAFIAWISTIILPFLWGRWFHKKIYQKLRHKYNSMKKIAEGHEKNLSKQELAPYEQQIFICEEKVYGYYHWFYCVVFFLFCICWTVTIHFMQILPYNKHVYNWYWLAGMAICFFFEHFIYEPIIVALFHNREAMKNRGGYYYDIRLGQLYQQVSQ